MSIANILSLIGCVVLSAGAAVGMLLTGSDMVSALVVFIAALAIGGGALFVAVKAKQTDNDFRRWRTFEFIAVGVGIVFVIAVAHYDFYAFNFLNMRGELGRAGNEDIATVEHMIGNYKNQENERLRITVDGLRNYVNFRPLSVSASLRSFIDSEVLNGQGLQLNNNILDNYEQFKSFHINHGDLQADRIGGMMRELQRLSDEVNGIDPTKMRDLSTSLTTFCDSVGAQLTSLSRNFNFGSIDIDDTGVYNYQPGRSNSYEARAMAYGETYSSIFHIGATAVLLYAAFALLYFSNYLLALRSLRRPTAGVKISDTDGIPL